MSLFAGIITFYFSSLILRMSNSVLLFDAAGLAFFAVTGASKALAHELNPIMAIVLGMVTGIGGGMARDVLLAEIPTVQNYMPSRHWQPQPSWWSGTCCSYPSPR